MLVFNRAALAAMAAAAAGFLLFLLATYGARQAALAAAAMALGAVFFRSQFGFAYTWRMLLVRRDGTGLRAQMLWVGLAALPFALLTSGDFGLAANVRPLTTAVAAGAFVFGIGMQLGGACTSGSIVGAGGGSGVAMLAIVGFVAGALLAAAHGGFWNDLPAAAAFSFFQAFGAWGGALAMMAAAAAVAAGTLLLRPRTAAAAAVPGRLSLARAAALLAALSVALLWLGGQPWGIINGMTVLGGKALLATGHDDILFWDFWTRFADGESALTAGWFAGAQMTTNAGMLLGVALAAALAGKLSPPWRGASGKRLALAAAGGVLMGYGAQISYGCNIGSFISALSSGSAHGWLWLLFAFAGTAAGVRARRAAGLEG